MVEKMIKVLIVANGAKEFVNKFLIPTIRYLKEQGWQVDVACSVDADVPICDNLYNMSWKRSPFTFNTFKGIRELKKLIAQNEYDIVYCHTPVGGLVSRLASRNARKKGMKVVYCAHGLHFYNGAPIINWLLYYPMEKWMSNMTDMFITINTEDYERVRKDFNHRMYVEIIQGIGVDFNRLNVENRETVRKIYRDRLNIPQNAEVLIYVAEILKNKNQQMLINALRHLHDKGREMFLLLPGPDHSKGEFKKLADELGLKNHVRFLDWRCDIGQLMAASDLCVASSIREGFGINLVEALYCHLPVVAVDNRGHRTIIKDTVNGFLVPLNDAKAMAERVLEIMDNKELYKRFSNVNVEKYRCENIAKEIYGYLLKVIR